MSVSNNTAMQSFEVDVLDTDVTKERIITFPIDIALIRGKWFNEVVFGEDYIEMLIAPNSPIGILTAPAVTGDTVLNVSFTITENTEIGYFLKLGGEDLGRVIEIDHENNTVTVQNALASDFSAGNVILQTIKMIPYLFLDSVDAMMTFEGGVDTMTLPANTPLVVRYHNENGQAKKYSVKIEYHY